MKKVLRYYLTVLIIFLVLTVSFLTYCFYPIIFFKEDSENIPGRILLHDRNGILITDKSIKGGYKEKNISYARELKIIKGVIKIEDKKYFDHFGVNIISKLRAFKDNILSGRVVSGGSTITEQYIKNRYFKGQKRTILQKSRETFLAFIFTIKYEKDTILDNYLNNTYFGNNIYGLIGASNIYFNKNDLSELTKEEITILISLINNPGIKSLEEKNFREYFESVKNRLGYDFERKIFFLNKKENIDVFPFVSNEKLGTIDSELQQFSKDILNKTLLELKNKNVSNGAIFAINPKTNEILIYQGSRDFYSKEIDGQVDVIKSFRQPGSTMKPFLYLLALNSGANPDDLIVDMESEYNSFQAGKVYITNNYSLKEFGLVKFKKALGNSLNNATVRLAKELGLQKVYDFYKAYGFNLQYDAEYYGYSLVLGNPSLSLESLVKSYIKLLPNGKDKNKFFLYDILSDPDNRDLSFGVNSILNTSIYQAVKTGTSSDFRDNLIISYHPDLVIGIWIGNNDNSSMVGVTGITGAGYIWHHVIEKAIELGYIKDRELVIPEGIIESEYCLDKKCFRKELIFKKDGKKYFSKIIDKVYDERDLFENLSEYEIERLGEKGVELTNP